MSECTIALAEGGPRIMTERIHGHVVSQWTPRKKPIAVATRMRWLPLLPLLANIGRLWEGMVTFSFFGCPAHLLAHSVMLADLFSQYHWLAVIDIAQIKLKAVQTTLFQGDALVMRRQKRFSKKL